MLTLFDARASRMAVARPTPRDAPVTIAFLPFKSMSVVICIVLSAPAGCRRFPGFGNEVR
jgi:hypothetical protein